LNQVGIAEKLYERTDRLSWWTATTVAIARVLSPNLLFWLMEPISSLDEHGREDHPAVTSVKPRLRQTLILAFMLLNMRNCTNALLVYVRDAFYLMRHPLLEYLLVWLRVV